MSLHKAQGQDHDLQAVRDQCIKNKWFCRCFGQASGEMPLSADKLYEVLKKFPVDCCYCGLTNTSTRRWHSKQSWTVWIPWFSTLASESEEYTCAIHRWFFSAFFVERCYLSFYSLFYTTNLQKCCLDLLHILFSPTWYVSVVFRINMFILGYKVALTMPSIHISFSTCPPEVFMNIQFSVLW